MKNYLLFFLPSTLVLTVLIGGCGNVQTPFPTATEQPATSTPTITITPDLCASENIQAEVDKVHRHMREFDDASILASSTPRDQLSGAVADLQKIRREAEDEKIPSCLADLKKYQIQHMNSVIDTLIAFIGGNSDQAVLDLGISLARQQHDQYTLELARILGITIVPATAVILPTQTPTP
ncbi:MAG TPA: hypothetical protein VFC02_00620 [Anaerolineales bacterium]|jgi:hypothetical protein|nr:hypothetical protein [Anaerolineales bacterium]